MAVTGPLLGLQSMLVEGGGEQPLLVVKNITGMHSELIASSADPVVVRNRKGRKGKGKGREYG